ncbi:MAG: 50S ribosomal protein L11 methyltransferase [Candidatus Methylomirabilia bacterium]
MKTDAFGSCPRLISDRVRVTLPAALAKEAEALAAAIMERPVRSKTVPEGALLLVQLIQKGSHGDALVERLVAAFEELERRNAGATVSLEREQWYADEDRDARHPEQFRPFLAAPGLLVTPAWQPRDPAPGQQVLAIDPGQAFGSGYHASTRLALGLLRERTAAVVPRRMLDVGTGTGILALAGAIWGAAEVLALDVKPEAVAAARANAARNGLAARVRVASELPPIGEAAFDLIVANITADVLQRLAGEFVSRLAAGGALVLSGMLADLQSDEVGAAYEALGCRRAASRSEGEWEALLFVREGPEPRGG